MPFDPSRPVTADGSSGLWYRETVTPTRTLEASFDTPQSLNWTLWLFIDAPSHYINLPYQMFGTDASVEVDVLEFFLTSSGGGQFNTQEYDSDDDSYTNRRFSSTVEENLRIMLRLETSVPDAQKPLLGLTFGNRSSPYVVESPYAANITDADGSSNERLHSWVTNAKALPGNPQVSIALINAAVDEWDDTAFGFQRFANMRIVQPAQGSQVSADVRVGKVYNLGVEQSVQGSAVALTGLGLTNYRVTVEQSDNQGGIAVTGLGLHPRIEFDQHGSPQGTFEVRPRLDPRVGLTTLNPSANNVSQSIAPRINPRVAIIQAALGGWNDAPEPDPFNPAPEQISNIRVVEAGWNNAIVEWAQPSADIPITAYQYRVKLASESNWGETLEQSGQTVRLAGLTSGVTYDFQARALSGPTPGAWVLLKIATRPPLAPTRPTAFSATPSGPTGVRLRWLPPTVLNGDPIRSYVVAILDNRNVPLFSDTVSGTTTVHTVHGLLKYTRYGFHVTAVNRGGNSPSTDILTATPGPVFQPANITGVVLPLLAADRQSFIARLNNTDIRLEMYWQPSDNSWYADLEVPVNTPVVTGKRLALNTGLLDRRPEILEGGNIVCRSLQAESDEPVYTSFAQPTHALVWEA